MLLGMMVVGTSASYSDVDAQDNLEAIEVMQLIGVMEGDEKGNFNPDQKVTRNEMAVIMTHLLDLNLGGATPFTDVPSWAKDYVAACYENGVVAGTSATTYGGDTAVTAAQAALMVMKSLGYFGYQGEFGDDWQLSVVKQASKIGLFKGINAAVTAPMTRNEVAKLVLNALESNVQIVEEKGGIDVNGSGLSVNVKPEYSYSDVKTSDNYINGKSDGYQQLAEKLFGNKLKKTLNAQADDFGRPSSKWAYRGDSVLSPKSADLIYTAEVESKEIYADLGLSKNLTATYYTDGNATEKTFAVGKNNTTAKVGGNGVVVEVYKSEDDAGNVSATIVEIKTYAEKVTKVVAAKGDKDAYVVVDNKQFETEAFEKDDVVLYTEATVKNGTKTETKIETMKLAEKVADVEVTKATGTKSFVADGITYKYAVNNNGTVAVKQNIDLYLTEDGFVAYTSKVSADTDYAYVLNTGLDTDRYGDKVFFAKLLLADGTVAEAELDDEAMKLTKKADVNAYENFIVEYSKDSDDVYTLTKCGDKATTGNVTIDGGKTKMTLGTTVYANAKTLFLVEDNDKYTAYTGYANVPDMDAEGVTYAVYAKGQVATVVYVKDAGANSSADEVIYVQYKENPTEIKDKDAGTYYEYDAVVNGEITTIYVEKKIDADQLWSSVVYNEYDVVVKGNPYTADSNKDSYVVSAKVTTKAADGIIGLGNEKYVVSDDVEVYKVNPNKGEITVADMDDLTAGKNVKAIITDGAIETIFWTVAPKAAQ